MLFRWARQNPKLKVLPAVERELIIHALQETKGNQVHAAKLLGITRATLAQAGGQIQHQTRVEYPVTGAMPRKSRTSAVAWLVAVALASWNTGGLADVPAARYSVEFWHPDLNGLPQSSITAMTLGRDGYLWLGTINGLVRFDGTRFTTFDENNTPALKSSRINFLFTDSRDDRGSAPKEG